MAVVIAVWGFLWIVDSWKDHLQARVGGGDPTWSGVLVETAPWWAVWACLTPVAGWFARRALPAGGSTVRAVAAVTVGAAAFALIHLGLTSVVFELYGNLFGRLPDISLGRVERRFASFFFRFSMAELFTGAALIGGFWALDYYRRLRDREIATARLEARSARLATRMAEARLSALARQLNPHFLFNSLNAVSGYVRRRENEAALHMMARLADLLRLSLRSDLKHEIPLREELDLLRRYVEIEEVRFGDRLRVEVDIDAEVMGALVPTLLIQPLVENAVRHGVAASSNPVEITVRANPVGERLRLLVRDTGPGLVEGNTEPGEGVGLSNTRERLHLLYGRAASLAVSDLSGMGVEVRVELPLHRQPVGLLPEPVEPVPEPAGLEDRRDRTIDPSVDRGR